MKKLLLLLLFPLFLGSTSKYEYKYEMPFAPVIYHGVNDSIPTIDQFGRIRNGIIAQGIIGVLNTDPSGVKLTRAELDYIRSIVGGLYATGIWQRSSVIYGIVGGNAWKHKWNWKDMRDVDGAYRLTYSGTITHSSNGMQFNGLDSYSLTYFNPSIECVNDATILHYTNQYTSGVENGLLSNISGVVKRFTSSYLSGNFFSQFKTNSYNFTTAITTGTKISTTSVSSIRGFLRGLKVIDQSTVSGSFPNSNMIIGARASDTGSGFFISEYMAGSISFFALSNKSLTDTQAIQSSNIITYSQGILGRK